MVKKRLGTTRWKKVFSYIGHEWMPMLLSNVSVQMRKKLLLVWWRTWHLRNNVILDDGKFRIEVLLFSCNLLSLQTMTKQKLRSSLTQKGKKDLRLGK
jgi:hypothetical protein